VQTLNAWSTQLNSSENTTFERLRGILANEFEVATQVITPDARLDSLGIDSLAVIEVIFRLEDEFKISFPQDPGELSTVGNLVSSIDHLVAQQREKSTLKAEAP
jgi:acyl carrier protein